MPSENLQVNIRISPKTESILKQLSLITRRSHNSIAQMFLDYGLERAGIIEQDKHLELLITQFKDIYKFDE